MNTQGSTITQIERESLDKFSEQGKEEIQSSESIQPYSLTLMGVEDSMKSLDESKTLTKELMTKLKDSSAPNDKQLIVRCAKELRETLKVKLDIAKFAHIVGNSDNSKKASRSPVKETA